MNNFHLQVTPVEVTYESKEPISISCLFKKVLISTGHLLEKHQIKSSSQLCGGKVNFNEGPVFAMSKEFQAKNTKISLHFLAKKDRNISCIGSTELYVGNLPSQPYSLIELKLDNCQDPKAKLKLQIQRKQQQHKQAKKINKPEKMGLLQTEGQQRQQFILSQRSNPSIPNAYQISRRNYKNVQISHHEQKKADKTSNSRKKVSYQQRHTVLSQLNPTNKSNKSSLVKNQNKTNNNSPMPRRKTPQPIQIIKNSKTSIAKPIDNNKYNISGKSKIMERENGIRFVNEEAAEEPQRLKVKPYSQQDSQNIENVNRNGLQSLQQQKDYKYKCITEKLQKIHDRIANSKERVNTEQYSSNTSHQCQQNHRSCIEKFASSNQSQALHRVQSTVGKIQSFNPSTDLKMQQSPKILNQSNVSDSQKIDCLLNKFQNIENKFESISSVKNKSPLNLVQTQKVMNKQSKLQQQKFKLEERQIMEAQIDMYKSEIEQYKSDLANAIRSIKEKDYQIQGMNQDIDNYKEVIQQKQNLLLKINQQYQILVQENFQLKEQRLGSFKREESVVGQFRISQASSIKQETRVNEELLSMKKKMVELQSQLKFKQNENKCLSLQIDNLKRQKKNLEQQVQILVSKDKNQITRKASIARIEQIGTNSLAHNTKKQNQILKNQIKILQQKLESLNSLFESLIHPDDKLKNKPQFLANPNVEFQKKQKLLQQKCMILQGQLKKKKNELAQVINVIWKHQNGDLMNEVFALITQSQ